MAAINPINRPWLCEYVRDKCSDLNRCRQILVPDLDSLPDGMAVDYASLLGT